METIGVITEPAAAIVALDPVRTRLLAELREPASAATLAARVGLTRQKVNYHVRALAAHGLVDEAGTRRWGGLTERLLQATAVGYLVAPDAISAEATDPSRTPGRLSAAYLLALAARTVRDVAALARRARAAGREPELLALDTELSFASPAARAAFADELTAVVAGLVARHHAEGGRPHRLVVAAHPIPAPSDPGGSPTDPPSSDPGASPTDPAPSRGSTSPAGTGETDRLGECHDPDRPGGRRDPDRSDADHDPDQTQEQT